MSAIKVATTRNMIVPHAPQLLFETEVSITLLCQLFSTRYTVVQIKNSLKSMSVIKVATKKNTTWEGSHHLQPPN